MPDIEDVGEYSDYIDYLALGLGPDEDECNEEEQVEDICGCGSWR
jgi:hypothetical protein